MPLWKYLINRLSTLPARLVMETPLTDFHTGFRVYRRTFLEKIQFLSNDDDYLFSFQVIAQACFHHFKIAEVPAVCHYYENVTQINFKRSMIYGKGSLQTLMQYSAAKIRKDTELTFSSKIHEN